MLHFPNLSKLDDHITYLTQKIGSQNIFLVGGCVRDLLLDINDNPSDIDLTMTGKPEKIYKNINKTGLSHFITEKFGTITLIEKPKLKAKDHELETKYELTPLRTEGGYDDFRHPGEIHRSNDILLDSDRRDFTFNCMYYFNAPQNNSKQKETAKTIDTATINDVKLIKLLDKYGFVYMQNLNLYVLQDHNCISKLFKNGEYQSDFLPYLQNISKETIVSSSITKDTKKDKTNTLRFIIDPHKGIQALINKKIQTVGNADKRFNEDALRIIRGLRLVNILNSKLKEYYSKNEIKSNHFFDYERETRQSTKRNAHLIKNVAKERIKDELTKVFISSNPFGFIALLDEIKLLEHLFPALHATKHIDQPTRFHPFDIYTHTILTLYELQKINTNYLVKFAMLYHDVGKVGQFDSYKENLSKEEIREILAGPLNHRRNSPEFVKKDFNRLGFSKKEIDDIARYVAQHHRPEEFLGEREGSANDNKIKKLRKFLSEAGYERVLNVLDICIADRMGQYNPLQSSSDVGDVYEVIGQLNILHESEGQFTMQNLAVKGGDIIKKFKLKPGPQIGELLNKAFQRAIDDIDNKNNKKSLYEYLKNIIR